MTRKRESAHEIDTSAKQGSISFLKKRNKKLLLYWLTRVVRTERFEMSKSFLVLFFKKGTAFFALRGAETG